MFKAFAISALGTMAVGMLFVFGGRLEGYFSPATTQFSIKSVEVVDATTSRISGELFRPRDECSFAALDWQLQQGAGSSASAAVVFEDGTIARPGGWADFGPWRVQIPAEIIEGSSLVYVYHHCHPFWLTRTQIYP